MKSNFDFLNRYWPALAQIGATAETYVYSDPNACIYKLGMFAERLVQEILVFEHIAEPTFDNTHANRIRILKRAGLLPHEIDNTLYVLRKTRNSAVHIGTDSVDDAKTLLSLTYNLAVWFMETYGDWGYIAPEFVMPSETTHEDLESVIAEQERKIEELTKQLAVVKTAASGKTQKERARRSESVSAMMNWNEAQTRCLIDEQLRLSGWEADTQNLRYSKGTRPVKGRNIAISEWPTNSAFYKNGYADYAFFIGEKLVALMDAKKMSEDVASTIDVQVKDYAAHIKPEDIPHTVGNWNGYQVPFLLASNGRAYLEQLRTKSGIWFLDVREQENQPYPIRNWFSPSDLMEKLGQNTAAANQALAAADNSFMTDPNGLNLRDYQIKAIDKATEAIVDGKRTALLAMATGTGKTRTVLGLIYKMLESKRFRRILFLVDRVSLGEQAMDTFKDVKLKELLTLDKIYEIKAIDDNIINLETKVSISTVQGLLKRTILAEEPDLMPGAFDLIIVDEAHRGYILDREMTEEEILYDNQDDYMSKYKQVIEYFDAVKSLYENYGITVLQNLEKFQEYTGTDEQDKQYYELVANAFSTPKTEQKHNSNTRFYIQKRTPFYVGKERYFEVTLQQADIYASKYNRITAYTKLDISTGYSVQIDYVPSYINLWGVNTEIKIITAWRVSVDPKCLNKLGRILNMRLQLSSKYGEYDALMRFLTETGMDFLEMIDLREIPFSNLLESVYKKANTSYFKDVLQQLRDNYSTGSTRFGRYTIRYLLLNLREDLLERVMPSQFSPQWKCKDLYLSRKCFPFECNPLASDLADSKTSQISQAKYLARVVEKEKTEVAVPYWSIVKSMQDTGEIYCDLGGDLTEQAIQKYNDCLDDWEKRQGYEIISDGNAACIAAYEASTLFILNKLLELSRIHNKGQKEVNERYLRNCDIAFSDPKKEEALKYAFVNSRVLLVYGAAGTGKTTLIDMISTMLSGRRKLFLTKTHTALQNLQRRINNPGADASFVSINSFTKRVNLPDYDVIFVDECSTIDNRAMKVFLEKMRPDTFLVLAGDTYQIESIDFGNWFTYAKDIIKTKGSNVELVSTWRTKDPGLIELWNETRNKGALITEKLVIDGPFSENIGEGVLNSEIMDEVILCLNYDGKFGLNNMNSYFQNANTETAVVWRDWKYKVGDHILFNDTDRFSLLYNNLKGRIVQIELFDSRIRFTIDVEIPLTEQDCQNDGIEFIDIIDDVTRIRFDVLDFEEEMADEDRKKAIVPFQLAYAVSIHKAQGLEYRSVKVVIPSSNAEKITHGIFYTAITRAKEKLKIYWSSETMQEVVAGFSVDTSRQKSLAIIKEKLKQDKNT